MGLVDRQFFVGPATLVLLALLRPAPAAAQIVASAKTLTVTTANAVAANPGAARSATLSAGDQTLTVTQSGSTPTTLNLSQDLVALGIAASNMTPNQPALDAGPLFVQGVEYAKTHGIRMVVADPGAYYFLGLTEINAHFA